MSEETKKPVNLPESEGGEKPAATEVSLELGKVAIFDYQEQESIRERGILNLEEETRVRFTAGYSREMISSPFLCVRHVGHERPLVLSRSKEKYTYIVLITLPAGAYHVHCRADGKSDEPERAASLLCEKVSP